MPFPSVTPINARLSIYRTLAYCATDRSIVSRIRRRRSTTTKKELGAAPAGDTVQNERQGDAGENTGTALRAALLACCAALLLPAGALAQSPSAEDISSGKYCATC